MARSPLLVLLLASWSYLVLLDGGQTTTALTTYLATAGWLSTHVLRQARQLRLPTPAALCGSMVLTILSTLLLMPAGINLVVLGTAMLHMTALAAVASLATGGAGVRSLLYVITAVAAPSLATRWPVFLWLAPRTTDAGGAGQAAVIASAWVIIAAVLATRPAPDEVRHPR